MEPHIRHGRRHKAIREETGGLPVAHIRSMDEIRRALRDIAANASTCCWLTVFGNESAL